MLHKSLKDTENEDKLIQKRAQTLPTITLQQKKDVESVSCE